MDMVLCDELLQEIFHRLPPSSSSSVSLVSRRWLHLFRSSLTTLCLHLPNPPPPCFLPSILPRHTCLTSLTLFLSSASTTASTSSSFDQLLLSLASLSPRTNSRRRLDHLRFLLGPVTPRSLVAASSFFPFRSLTSLHLSCLSPLSFRWLSSFPYLKEFLLLDCSPLPPPPDHLKEEEDGGEEEEREVEQEFADVGPGELPLERLTLCGIRSTNRGFRWLWERCSNLQRLQLRGCEGTGDEDHLSSSSFACRLHHLRHLELRTSRSIADRVLLQVADHCRNLRSLLLYDGGSRDGLRTFLRRCSPGVRLLDFRLPLDLDNTHLALVAERLTHLATLRLQSCCLVTGEGLRSIGAAIGGSMEELVLVNCDVIEKETGLLAFLGQKMRWLRRLDLSYNEMLVDRELNSMLVSCGQLVEVRVKGCGGLTDAAMVSMFRCCRMLEMVDVTYCAGITMEGVEFLIRNARRLSRIIVDQAKVSETATAWAFRRATEVCHLGSTIS